MPTHDIIDNRTERLVDHLNRMLGTSERARFAVGYLFLSGLTSIASRLLNLKDAAAQRSLAMSDRPVPRIICSEALV